MSVFSKEYCEKMRVRIDCGNMLAEAVGKHGITAEEISEMLPRAEGAFAGVEKKSGEMRWRLLPETQLEILPAVEEAAEFVRSKADNFSDSGHRRKRTGSDCGASCAESSLS